MLTMDYFFGEQDNFVYQYSEPLFEDDDDHGAFQETEDQQDDHGRFTDLIYKYMYPNF